MKAIEVQVGLCLGPEGELSETTPTKASNAVPPTPPIVISDLEAAVTAQEDYLRELRAATVVLEAASLERLGAVDRSAAHAAQKADRERAAHTTATREAEQRLEELRVEACEAARDRPAPGI